MTDPNNSSASKDPIGEGEDHEDSSAHQDLPKNAVIGLSGIPAAELAELVNKAVVAVETVSTPSTASRAEQALPISVPQHETNPYTQGLEEEINRLRTKSQALSDDFDRFRQRTRDQSRKKETELIATLVSKLLPLLDNMERAANASRDTELDFEVLREGLIMVHEQFLSLLQEIGVFEVETEDLLFDPQNHEAVQQINSDDLPDGTIASVNQKGFRIGKRLLRPAQVVVFKKPR